MKERGGGREEESGKGRREWEGEEGDNGDIIVDFVYHHWYHSIHTLT